MLCTEFTAVKHDGPALIAAPLHCRRWQCEECRELRQRELYHLACSGEPTTFLTLTISATYGESRAERAQALVAAWRKLQRRALAEAKRPIDRRPMPAKITPDPERVEWKGGAVKNLVRLKEGRIPFIAVFEQHKSGEPHLHILMRGVFMHQDFISKTMQEFIGSPSVWIEKIKDGKKRSAYITKYIVKNPEKFDGVKRYWRSQDYSRVEHDDAEETTEAGAGWEVKNERFDSFLESMAMMGYQIEEGRGRARLWKPPARDPPEAREARARRQMPW